MSYTKDPVGLSLIWGRIGAAILAIIAFVLQLFGYALSPEDQATGAQAIQTILSGLIPVLIIASKVRESKKAKA
jgi:hypothetical protein